MPRPGHARTTGRRAMTTLASVGASIRRPGIRALPRPAVLYLLVGFGAIGAYFLLEAEGRELAYLAIGASAVVAVYAGARRLEEGGLAWRLFAAGLLAEVLGDLVSTYHE